MLQTSATKTAASIFRLAFFIARFVYHDIDGLHSFIPTSTRNQFLLFINRALTSTHHFALGSIGASCRLRIEPVANAHSAVRLGSELFSVRKQSSGKYARTRKLRYRRWARRASKTYSTEVGGSCVVHHLISRQATNPNSLEAAANAPIELVASAGPSAEEFPKPGPESPKLGRIGAALPESVWNCEIRIEPQDRTDSVRAAGLRASRHRSAIIAGSLLAGLGLGLGWLSQSVFTAATPNKPVSSPCATESDKGTICDVGTPDRLESPAPTSSASQDAKAIFLPTKPAALSKAPTAVSLPTKQTTLSPAPATVDPPKLSAGPVAVPETRPATIKGWTVRNVIGVTAVLEGPNGIRNVRRGDKVHGLGKIEDILRWGKWWIVATERGLISTQ